MATLQASSSLVNTRRLLPVTSSSPGSPYTLNHLNKVRLLKCKVVKPVARGRPTNLTRRHSLHPILAFKHHFPVTDNTPTPILPS